MSDEKKLYRQIQRKFRVTPEENELIKSRMELHNFSNFNTYARYMLLTGEVVTVDYSELIKLRTEINRIGTNINQLVKYVNTNEEVSLENYRTLQESLAEVKRLVDENFNREIAHIEKVLKERKE
ncbi:TPA: plasmid mobilization relaxosome protein MobC [Streptococcus suis]|uniref:Plasmid mobilization relaxosome protein MobC n=1 Tax=Streptococcus suivaginalis TaxID=3028082 RepID=A0AA96VC32_9STRE|nr:MULTISPECIES: plasmid mobilization relaxosome protein MobC [Streptococcus]AML46704.1 mobilization protein [Streptococcus suis]MBS8054938.1 MobC family plasmid mobilization relaxosome protein [Streptococcus suis]MBY5027638.1 MobC family plasmid mobilization relaxosome protein [Streptococcus suis]MCB2962770.1 plasmid mobilization relaxosome protein MobC [Streptococcus suis]MCE6987058.1 MobC family plasmid mobilization relaxosome protein [Streptococcus suis]